MAPGELLLRANLSAADGALIGEGARVLFRADAEIDDRIGTVSTVTTQDGRSVVDITPEASLATDAQGRSFRVAAITGSSAGLATVRKQTPAGPVDVGVRAGLVADGYVEVSPVNTDELTEGDEVVVGS